MTLIQRAARERSERQRVALLKRSGLFGSDTCGAVVQRATTLDELRQAYRLVYREKLPLVEARAALETLIGESSEEVAGPLRQLAAFLAEPGRGIVR